jgi:hypothetical protein
MIDTNLHKDKRKIMLVILGTLIVLLGITYAYYIAQIGPGSKTNINLTSDTLDKLTFTQGTDLSLNATQFNFTNGGSNLTSSTTASATLVANSTNNTASDTYNAYIDISSNSYIYTQNESTPEIILTITNPTGANITTMTGLTYVTSNGVSGFDITNKTGVFSIAEDYAISTTSSTTGTTQNWNVTLTYLNLAADQSNNAGHSMSAKLYLGTDYLIGTKAIKVDIDPNMIPIMYAETCPVDAAKDSTNGCWVKADNTNANATYKWYDYDNHIWANAATVTTSTLSTYKSAAVGTPVLYADTMGYFVYIPRYSYKLFNVNADGGTYSTAQEILVNFENTSNTKSSGSNNGTYLTHPAFTFGDKELNGFWIGKFETSYTSDNTSEITSATALAQGVTVKPSISTQTMYSLRYMTVSNLYTTMTSLYNGGGQANSNHNLNTLESTMLTNMQWGAVAYLTESVYGVCTGTKGSTVCTAQPQINSVGNTSTWGAEQTGCGPQSAGSTDSGTTCNYYNTPLGKLASTTQNIYGVYDMNGGAWEYVMATTYNSAGTSVSIGYNATYNSGFYCGTSPTCTYYNTTDNITSGTALLPNAKYYDLYNYGTTYNDAAAYTRGKLGDATKEVVASSGTTWYGSNARFPSSSGSWFGRGGNFDGGTNAGVLFFSRGDGYAYSNYSGRVALH